MRGKELEVRFKIGEVKYVELPALNQSFLESIGGFEDEDELREAVRHELERQLVYTQQRRLREQITAHFDAERELGTYPPISCGGRRGVN